VLPLVPSQSARVPFKMEKGAPTTAWRAPGIVDITINTNARLRKQMGESAPTTAKMALLTAGRTKTTDRNVSVADFLGF